MGICTAKASGASCRRTSSVPGSILTTGAASAPRGRADLQVRLLVSYFIIMVLIAVAVQ